MVAGMYFTIGILILLISSVLCGWQSNLFQVWERTSSGQIDIYAPNTLTISRAREECGDITGYYHSLESNTTSATYVFGRGVCKPYTVTKWSDGRTAVVGSSINGSALLVRGSTATTLPIANFTQIKYDLYTHKLYTYSPPLLHIYDGLQNFTIVKSYRIRGLQSFYVSNGHIFYTVNGTAAVYREKSQDLERIGKVPRGEFYRLFVYKQRSATCAGLTSTASHILLFTATVFLFFVMFMIVHTSTY